MGWGGSLDRGTVAGLCPPFLCTPLGLAHARVLVLTKGNKVAAAELIKEGGGGRAGAGKTRGHLCQVSSAVPACQFLGGVEVESGAPPRAEPAPLPRLHLSAQQMGHVMPAARTCQALPGGRRPRPHWETLTAHENNREEEDDTPSPTRVEKIGADTSPKEMRAWSISRQETVSGSKD